MEKHRDVRLEIVMKPSPAPRAQGRCIHCLNLTEVLEADQVFPASWYAPSCPKCNRELGQLERDLLVRLVPCTDPESEATAGLAGRVFRARIRSEFIPPAEAAEEDTRTWPALRCI
jgi:hypothetical protein